MRVPTGPMSAAALAATLAAAYVASPAPGMRALDGGIALEEANTTERDGARERADLAASSLRRRGQCPDCSREDGDYHREAEANQTCRMRSTPLSHTYELIVGNDNKWDGWKCGAGFWANYPRLKCLGTHFECEVIDSLQGLVRMTWNSAIWCKYGEVEKAVEAFTYGNVQVRCSETTRPWKSASQDKWDREHAREIAEAEQGAREARERKEREADEKWEREYRAELDKIEAKRRALERAWAGEDRERDEAWAKEDADAALRWRLERINARIQHEKGTKARKAALYAIRDRMEAEAAEVRARRAKEVDKRRPGRDKALRKLQEQWDKHELIWGRLRVMRENRKKEAAWLEEERRRREEEQAEEREREVRRKDEERRKKHG